MVPVTVQRLSIAALAGAALALASCSGGSRNAAPRVQPIPAQTTTGGTFSIDLSKYVTDREKSTLTYSVVSGGGNFTSSTYSNTFPTLGEHTVTVKITDAAAKTAQATFVVKVTQSDVAVLQAGTVLVAMDEASAGKTGHTTINTGSGYTDSFLELSAAQGVTDTFKAATARGCIIYERQMGTGTKKDLFCYDPFTKMTKQLGTDPGKLTDELYLGKTSKGQVAFQTGAATDTAIYLFDSISGMTKLVSDQASQLDGNAMVAADDKIYYERGVNGQADVYVYDVASGTSVAVATDSKVETIRAVLPNSAVLYTRLGTSTETDLFYWKSGSGEIEVGADLGATAQSQTKGYVGRLSDSRVLFTLRVGASDDDLYLWDPATATSTLVNASFDTLNAVTANDTVVFTRTVGGLGTEVSFWTATAGTTTDIGSSSSNESFIAVTSINDIVILRADGSGDGLFMWDTSATTLRTLGATGSGAFAFDAVLPNGDIVYNHPTSGVWLWDESAATALNTGDNTYAYAGTVGTAGKAVLTRTVSAQNDLYFFDGTTLVLVSSNAADEGFLRGMASDRVLFRRQGTTTYDVFLWDPSAPTVTTKLSQTTVDHSLAGSFSAKVD